MMTETSPLSFGESHNTSLLLPPTLMEVNISQVAPSGHLQYDQFTNIGHWVRVVCSLMATISIVIGTPANLMVILAVYRTRSLRTSMNALVVNLLIADLISCLFCCPVILVVASTIPHQFVCKLFDFTHILSGTVQLTTIAFLSFERHEAIRKPFDQQRRMLRIRIGIVMCWMLGVVLSTGSVCMTGNPFLLLCAHDHSLDYHWYEFGFYIFLPIAFASIIAILVFYMRIVYQVSKHTAKRDRRLAWKQKVNKVNPMVSCTIALVHASSSHTQDPSQGIVSPPLIGGCSTVQTSVPEIEPTAQKQLPSVPLNNRKRKMRRDTGNILTAVRKTMSDSTLPGVRSTIQGIELKPKYSHDSKIQQFGQLPLTVQGFLSPSRPRSLSNRSSLYHSDDNLSQSKASPLSIRSKANSEPVTFTALESLPVLDREGIKDDQVGAYVTAAQNLSTVQTALKTVPKLDSPRNQQNRARSSRKSLEIKAIPNIVMPTPRRHDDDSKEKEEACTQPLKRRLTRRIGTVDIVQIHDIDGITTRAKVTSNGIVGDICIINSESKEQGKRRVEQRTAKRTAIIVVAFLGCWTPLLVSILASLMLDTGTDDIVRIWSEAYLLTLNLTLLAAVINPTIYGIINNQFRAALIRMLRGYRNKWCNRVLK